MTSTPRESRHWSRRQLLLFLTLLLAPVMFSAALATPVQVDGEAEKDANPVLQYLKRYISKRMGYIFSEDASANLLPLQTSTLEDDGEEDTDLTPEHQEMTRLKDDEDFTQLDRILEYFGERGDEDRTMTTSTQKPSGDKPKQLDPWSLVWYIGSFGGLVAFFLAVSCSECCCHKPASSLAGPAGGGAGAGMDEPPRLPAVAEGPPPPPYSMFAPPPYDSLCYGVSDQKDKLEVFVVPVPVHGAAVAPPTPPQDGHAHSQPP